MTLKQHFNIFEEHLLEIDKLLTDKDSINTQKATKLSVKCFRDYLCEQDHDKCCLNICNIVMWETTLLSTILFIGMVTFDLMTPK
jgi:hypothetical protein